MNKLLKRLFTVLTVATLFSSFVISGSAYTFYVTNDGLLYRDVSREKVAIGGLNTSTESLVIPAQINNRSVVMIDDYAMRDDTTLKSVDFSAVPEGFSIGEGTFLYCTSLESAIVPSTVRYVYEDAFRNCTSLNNIDFRARVSTIPSSFFSGCTALEEFSVPNSVTKIKNHAFAHCSVLEKVVIPQSVTDIDKTAFYECPNLNIYCYQDSYAQTFAVDNNIPYVLLDEYKLGDVDGNGNVDIRDVTEIQKHLAELGEPLGELNLYAADVNGDGDVDISDATAIQMFLAELDFSYPIGEITSKSN